MGYKIGPNSPGQNEPITNVDAFKKEKRSTIPPIGILQFDQDIANYTSPTEVFQEIYRMKENDDNRAEIEQTKEEIHDLFMKNIKPFLYQNKMDLKNECAQLNCEILKENDLKNIKCKPLQRILVVLEIYHIIMEKKLK